MPCWPGRQLLISKANRYSCNHGQEPGDSVHLGSHHKMWHPTLRWIFGFLTIVLCRSIAAQLPVQSSDPVASIAPAHFESESPSQYQLLQTQQTLEEAILNAEITFNAWDSRLSETMLSLAKVRTALGYTQQARLTYFHVLHNIRVNRGLYSVDQLPIILDLMQWYLADKEY